MFSPICCSICTHTYECDFSLTLEPIEEKSINFSFIFLKKIGSGVHGALVVLESSFNGDTMATALGIPPSRNMIRRHLTAELESLVLPARYELSHQ